MISIMTAVVYGLAGAILGFMLPLAAQKIAAYKRSQKSTELAEDQRYTAPLLRWAVCLSNGGMWAFTGLKMESPLVVLSLSILITVAILIAIIDLRINIIPNELVLVMLVTGIVFQILLFGIRGFLTAGLTMVAMIILFTVVAAIVGFGKVGAGDIKLAGAMGLALGYPDIVTSLIIMSAALLIYSFVGLISRKLTLRSMLPFAPFMMSGMVFALVYINLGRTFLIG